MGINFYNEFLDQDCRNAMAQRNGEIIEVLNTPTANMLLPHGTNCRTVIPVVVSAMLGV